MPKRTDEQRLKELQDRIDKKKKREELKKTLHATQEALRKLRK